MKYHRVTAHSFFWWLKWCCSLYMLLMVIFLTAYVVNQKHKFCNRIGCHASDLGHVFTVVQHTNFYKAEKNLPPYPEAYRRKPII